MRPFLFPCYAMIPTGVLGLQVLTRAWVPMADEHMMFFSMGSQPSTALQANVNANRRMQVRNRPGENLRLVRRSVSRRVPKTIT
jgi:hypothetical protein